TAAAREQRIAAAHRARRPLDSESMAAIFRDEIPARKRQRIQILDLFADDEPARHLALREAHHGRLRLAVQDEVAVVAEELGHLRRGDADEYHLHAARAHAIGPSRFR